MNCRKATRLLPLLAGGDLPKRQAREVQAHANTCEACRSELARIHQSLNAVRKIADLDKPTPLPEDFDWQVQNLIERSESPKRLALSRLRQWRPQLSFSGLALVVLLALFVAWESLDEFGPPVDERGSERSQVSWDEFRTRSVECIEGPYQLSDWEVPNRAGVYAIMHKPDPDNQPDLFVVDFCGESDRLSAYRNYPWIRQRERRMVDRAGSTDNVYIAVCLLDQSTRSDRREIEKALVREFAPFFNRKHGA